MTTRFIVDANVGKLARWLRILGYDTVFINNIEDNRLVRVALDEGRVLLTRDRQIAKRRLATTGVLKVIIIKDDDILCQLRQVVDTLGLETQFKPFTLCLECNHLLVERSKEEVKDLVPPYVFKTQTQYMQCPSCKRVYWRGTHWQRMTAHVRQLAEKETGSQ